MKKGIIIVDAVVGLVALAALVMLVGDTPEVNAMTFVAVKLCGGALLWAAYKALERLHPEWEE
jgi:hypothetical protein